MDLSLIFLPPFLALAAPDFYSSLVLGVITPILHGFADLIGAGILVIIGILIIVLLVGLAIIVLPAIIIAIVVWFLTGSFFYAGIAFLIVALISLVRRI